MTLKDSNVVKIEKLCLYLFFIHSFIILHHAFSSNNRWVSKVDWEVEEFLSMFYCSLRRFAVHAQWMSRWGESKVHWKKICDDVGLMSCEFYKPHHGTTRNQTVKGKVPHVQFTLKLQTQSCHRLWAHHPATAEIGSSSGSRFNNSDRFLCAHTQDHIGIMIKLIKFHALLFFASLRPVVFQLIIVFI